MYTRCPHCQTCFRIAEAHLKAAKGMVRCGSCKEVFDATSHIYDNMPDADPNEISSNPVIPEDDHEHIDLSSPPDRSNAPDQSPFMESMIGKDARYNNLDDMGTIDIPGETNFTESFIKFVETEYDPEKKIAAHPIPDPLIEQPSETPPENKPPINPGQSHEHTNLADANDALATNDTLSANPFIAALSQQQTYDSGSKTPALPTQKAPDSSSAPKLKSKPAPEPDAQPPKPTSAFELEPEPTHVPPPATPFSIEDDSDIPPMFVQNETEQVDAFEIKPEPPEREKSESEYEDIESLENPTTSTEFDGIDELYTAAQDQMDEPGSDPDKLNQDIEALLNDAMSLDTVKPAETKSDPLNLAKDSKDKISLDVDEPADSFLGDINFLEDAPEEPNEVLTQFEEELQNIEFGKADAASFSLDNDDALENLSQMETPKVGAPDFGEENTEIEDIVIGSAEPTPVPAPRPSKQRNRDDDESPPDDLPPNNLPSAEHDLPKALRSSFAHLDRPERPIGLSLAMGAGIFILVFALVGQMVLFRSYQLANQFPSLAPTLSSLCESIPCRFSGNTDVSQIELINRNVRSHPNQKNALLISTAFKNKAHFDQPYPTIAIKLSDLSGHIVATRYFTPEEYLEGLYNKFLLMESGTPVHVTLAVLDPGDDAINFEFSFL